MPLKKVAWERKGKKEQVWGWFVCKELAVLNHGNLCLFSSSDTGSEFLLELPLETKHA